MVLDVGVGCFRFFNNSKSNKPSWKTVWTQASTASSIIFLFSHFPPYFHMVGPMHFSFLSFQILFLLFLSFLITYFPFFLPTIFLSLHLFPNSLQHVSLPISFNHLLSLNLLIFLSHSLLHVIGERSKNSKKCEKIGKEEIHPRFVFQ
jgi:hypothetical protein